MEFSSSHVWMWELNYKKAEHRRIDAFELWCWKRLLRVPWTARRSSQPSPKGNQFWIFIGRSYTEAEAPILWPPDAKNQLIRKTLMLGKIEGRRRRGDRGWNSGIASQNWWTWVWASLGSWWGMGIPGLLQYMGSQRTGHNWVTKLNWMSDVEKKHEKTFVGM